MTGTPERSQATSPDGVGGARVIGFARHGETAWTGRRYTGHTDVPLTDEGRGSARVLAERVAASGLLDDPSAVVIASPLVRALDTARVVAASVGRPVEVDERWAEVSFGDLEGTTFDEAAERWPEITDRMLAADIEIDWPGGERWVDFRARIEAATADAVAREVPVLVVAHGIAVGTALAALLGRAHGPAAPLPAAGLVIARAMGGTWVLDGPDAASVSPSGHRPYIAAPGPETR